MIPVKNLHLTQQKPDCPPRIILSETAKTWQPSKNYFIWFSHVKKGGKFYKEKMFKESTGGYANPLQT